MVTLASGVDVPSELPPEVERALGEVAAKALAPLVDKVIDTTTLAAVFFGILIVGIAWAFFSNWGGHYPKLDE